MATNKHTAPVGPVPFKDVDNDADQFTALPVQRPPEEHEGKDPVTPSKVESSEELRYYQSFWLMETWVPAASALQRRFEPRADDVIVASMPKSGTTWLNALTFATMARRAYPPADAGHPLRRLNPHLCLPYLEGLFASGREAKLDELPSPRLMNTHMPLAMLPRAAPAAGSGGCRVVYICREPKDMAVSFWHYIRRVTPDMPFTKIFDSVCDGTSFGGPFWDHILGYWRASAATPDSVLFLRYEELLRDPAENVRKLARFVGLPFSVAEEEAGIVGAIVELCSFEHLRGLEANKTGYVDPLVKLPREALFRKGVAGDWVNHMTPEMAHRMDEIVADKLRATGLAFY